MSEASKLREQLWYGVKFKDALRDVIANNNTGYNYKDLAKAIEDGEDMLEYDEIENVDRTVNILLHLFVFYHSHKTEREYES